MPSVPKVLLYDTMSRSVRPFEPLVAGQAGLYCCGPTVYNYAHIGNLRTYVFEDLLRRMLVDAGYSVRHVMNITDVGHLTSDADEGEDKMELSSRRTGESAWDIAARYTRAFQDDCRALNLLEPAVTCRATDHIPEQIDFIRGLERDGYTYRIADGLYFNTARQANYGRLARLDPEKLRVGSRVELGDKRNPTDFALWRATPPNERRQMAWESPWGSGCPGWHIECSAMAVKYLGTLFDIHCGGEDHIPVHHSNEIAQTEARHGTSLANYWMHAAFLQVDAAKMSKSKGEFLRLASLVDRGYEPLAYRYLCLTAHYRGPLAFTWAALDAATVGLDRLRQAFHSWPDEPAAPDEETLAAFRVAIYNDLNMPQAMATVWGLVRGSLAPAVKRATLACLDDVVGLSLTSWQPACELVTEEVRSWAADREGARAAKDWQLADTLRGRISAAGYDLTDTAQGPLLKRRQPARDLD